MSSLVQAQLRGKLLSPWLLAGLLLAAMVGLNVFIWWIELSLDPSLVSAAEPAFEPIIRYVGLEFTGDSVGFAIAIVVSAVVLSRDRSNRFAWVFGAFSSFWMVAMVLVGLAMLSSVGRLPVDYAPWFAAVGAPFFLTFITGTFLLVALFPTGSFPPGMWRPTLRVAFAFWGVVALLATFRAGSPYPAGATPYSFSNPLGVSALAWVSGDVIDIGQAVVALLALASLVGRYRMADSEVRTQIKWVLAGMAFLTATSLLMELIDTPWEGYPVTVALWLTVAAIGVAILKYRLYEIDLIINRALVFALLVGFITLVYAGVVVGIGSLVGGSSVGWSIAATALVAVVFEPVRDRVQRWVNRLVYGRRATPYEVLSDLTGRLAATEREEGLLDRMALRLAEGTGADRAIVWVSNGRGLQAAATEPAAEHSIDPVAGIADLPGAVVPIDHDGELLGALSVETRRGDALTPTELRLVEDLAGSAGLLMRRLRLDASLEAKARELEESRRRLVDAQDVERRRLERQLEEGAQQQVVNLKEQLALAQQQAEAEGADKAASLIAQMAAETQDAIEQIRALANGIYPPLLEAEGLGAAVTALAEMAPVEAQVEVDVGGRYPLPVEGAVYFCVSEALTNAVKHGEAPLSIEISDQSGKLAFLVADAGPGFDLDSVRRGSGLHNMTDRLDALDGTISVTSKPGQATVVTGRVPVSAEVGVS